MSAGDGDGTRRDRAPLATSVACSAVEQPSLKCIAQPAIRGAVAALSLLAAFVVLAIARRSFLTSTFDSAVVNIVHAWRVPALTPWVVLITDLGSGYVAVPLAAIAVVIALLRRRFAAALLVIAVIGLGYGLGMWAQNFIRRPRPSQIQALIPVPSAFSFPSGHSITSFLVFGVIAFLIWRIARNRWERASGVVLCGILIALVGLSRVYLGVHWPTDVIGAWLLGGAWLALLIGVYISWRRYRAPAQEHRRIPDDSQGADSPE